MPIELQIIMVERPLQNEVALQSMPQRIARESKPLSVLWPLFLLAARSLSRPTEDVIVDEVLLMISRPKW